MCVCFFFIMNMGGFQISDEILGIFSPIVAYWIHSGVYTVLGSYFESYRFHTKQDEDEKNLVPKGTVIKGVLLQQFNQAIVTILLYMVTAGKVAESTATTNEQQSLIVLARQVITAMLVMDTYLYFTHRLFHQNKFLYKHFHSQHHRLVVPYAFGALYNHPLEYLVLDTTSGVLAFLVSGMSPRASIFFFTFSTMKVVDDHCGLWLPGNPFRIFENNTAYHYVHHQLYGSKYNFATPFFVMWDRILGTYMPCSVEQTEGGGFEVRPMKEYKDD